MAADRTHSRRQQLQPQQPWMDHIKARLPPCTLETLPEPIELPVSSFEAERAGDDDDRRAKSRGAQQQSSSRLVWPVLLGCYRLEPTNDEEDDDERGQHDQQSRTQQQRRSGRLDLLTIRVPNVTSNEPSMPLQFESQATTVLDPSTSSGILDCKWRTQGGRSETITLNPHRYLSSRLFATAHATGEVRVHALNVVRAPTEDAGGDGTTAHLDVQANVGVGAPSSELFPGARSSALCLSLNWRHDPPSPHPQEHPSHPVQSSQIVSTYSNGHVAIHDVLFTPNASDGDDDDDQSSTTCQIITRDCWSAHSMFTSPSEVWSAAFVGHHHDPYTISTGGDEGTLKLWDVRSTSRPTSVLKDHFGAGVTCISPHPRLPDLFAAGSYDESVNLYDVRNVATPLSRSEGLGGGIWRLQWHPINDRRLLVAAMHGGCLVTQYKRLVSKSSSSSAAAASTTASTLPTFLRQPLHEPSSLLYPTLAACPTNSFDSTLTDPSTMTAGSAANRIRLKVKKTFEEHESMVYGASWLVCRHPKQPGSYFEAAASCSFYDQNVYVWDSVF
jgi:WD40 repeat protein